MSQLFDRSLSGFGSSSFSPFRSLVPDHCSTTLVRLVKALFITHAASKLNTEGHLDGLVVPTPLLADRDDWCHDLVRREHVN